MTHLNDRASASTASLGTVDPDYVRGGSGPNGKPSLTTEEAGEQITRDGYTLNGQNVTHTPVNITYAFRATYGGDMPDSTGGFSTFNTTQIAATELALAAWADVANVTFTRVGSGDSGTGAFSDDATMLFGNYATGMAGAAAFAYYPVDNSASNIYSSDVWVNNSYIYNAAPQLLNYGQQVLVHEIGHALGLQHPGDYNAGPDGNINYTDSALYYEDTRQYSVMSYWGEDNTGGWFNNQYASAPLLDDIAAIQRLYGANMTTRTGNTVYGFNSNADQPWFKASTFSDSVIFAVWDAGGIDTFDFSGYTSSTLIDLRAGHFSSVGNLTGNVSIAEGVIIENAIGGWNSETIIGNDANNVLEGMAGNDTLNGGSGSDTASYEHSTIGISVNLSLSGAQMISIYQEYETLISIENLLGSSYNDTLIGNTGNNILKGGSGSDTAGFLGATSGVTVSLALATAQAVGGGQGSDTLVSIENLLGSNYNDTLTGNSADNVLEGAGGNDTLNGGGGSDTASYLRATSGVNVSLAIAAAQAAGGGMGSDTLISIENLFGSSFNDTLTGDGNANILEGGDGDDVLDGGGGADTASYRSANTSVNVDLAGALTIFTGSTQTDTLISIENVLGSDYNDTLSGNAANNVLNGNAGIDTINFNNATSGVTVDLSLTGAQEIGAGLGSDTLISIENIYGSLHDDVLTGSSDDNLFEGATGNDVINGGGGVDTVTYISASSGVTVNLSILTAQAVGGGQGSDTLSNIERIIGSTNNDVLTGDAGNNIFAGGGGDDILNGGGGIDTVDFSILYSGVTADLTRATAQVIGGGQGTDTLTNIENIIGTWGDDTLTGIASTTLLQGGEGNDTLTLSGKIANTANIDGGGGTDTLWLKGDYASGFVLTASTIINVETINFAAGYSYKITLNDATVQYSVGGNISAAALGVGDSLNLDASAETESTLYITGGKGVDTIKAGQYHDHIYMYNNLTAADSINGGSGYDWLYVGGDYSAGLTFGANTISNIESIYFSAGSNYKFKLNDGNIAAGQQLRIYGDGLTASDKLTIDGSAETDGTYYFTSHAGTNVLTGGAGNDSFNMLAGVGVLMGGNGDDGFSVGRDVIISPTDSINGGAGNDNISFLGNASGTFNLVMGATTLVDIEVLNLGMSDIKYNITTNNAAVGAGQTMSVDAGSALQLTFNGTAETDGQFIVHGSSHDDSITGGKGNDWLMGWEGNDVLNGGIGADNLMGAWGDDTYFVDNVGDIVNDTLNYLDAGGTDKVNASISYTLGSYIETLVLTGTANLNGTGNSLANILVGNAGNNILNGMAGADAMSGGLGDDTYYADNIGDVVTELSGQGTDRVLTDVNNYTLGANVENLFLTGVANINGKGNALANTLIGNDGNNTLNGGVGIDTMNGGNGNDTYIVDNVGDMVMEGATGGNDTIYSSIGYSLGGRYVESLFLTGTANINAAGNSNANLLVGNDGNNIINGGLGADTMNGGLGNDIYYVDDAGDVVIEGSTGGNDTVYSSISYSLGGRYVESLFLTGTANINAAGNSNANLLVGNDGNNIITGGLGADTMNGGKGNDTYYVDDAGDVVIEGSTGGNDTLYSTLSWSLSGTYVETLNLQGTGNINATGNGNANTLRGNTGNNLINGGAGNDILTGGGGNDIFWFGAGSGVDTITDFSNDTINLNAYSHGVTNGGGIVIAQSGGNTTIDLGGGNIITLTGVTPTDLNGHIVW